MVVFHYPHVNPVPTLCFPQSRGDTVLSGFWILSHQTCFSSRFVWAGVNTGIQPHAGLTSASPH